MGQVAANATGVQEYFDCAGRASEATACGRRVLGVPGPPGRSASSSTAGLFGVDKKLEPVRLLEEAISHYKESGFIQRCDMRTRSKLAYFHSSDLEDIRQQIPIGITSSGDVVQLDSKNIASNRTNVRLEVPETNYYVWGPSAKFMLRAWSEDSPNLGAIVKRCDTEDEVCEALLSLIRTGAQSLNLSLGREMFGLDFTKLQVVQEHESIQHIDTAQLSRCKIVTGFTWATVFHCRLLPAEDRLQREFDRLHEGRHSKAQIVREMQTRGVEASEIERFVEATGDDGTDTKTKSRQYYTLRSKHAHELKFFPLKVQHAHDLDEDINLGDDDDSASQRGDPTTAYRTQIPPDAEFLTVNEIVAEIVAHLRDEAHFFDNWCPLLTWEPLRTTTVSECMHVANQFQALGDEDGYVRMALRAVEIVASETHHDGAATTSTSANSTGMALSIEERDIILACSKAMIDRLVARYLAGNLHVDRFEESFSQSCERMLDIVTMLINLAQKNHDVANTVLYLRTQADYLRYLHVWIPYHRNKENEIIKAYDSALTNAQSLRPRHIMTITTRVNYSVFHMEVRRDPEKAAEVCLEGILKEGRRHLNKAPSPSEMFNWHLMNLNLEAFESRVVVIAVRFHPMSLAAHTSAAGVSESPNMKRAQTVPAQILEKHPRHRRRDPMLKKYNDISEADTDGNVWNTVAGGGDYGWAVGNVAMKTGGDIMLGCAGREQPEAWLPDDGEKTGGGAFPSPTKARTRRQAKAKSKHGPAVSNAEKTAVLSWLHCAPLRRYRGDKEEAPIEGVQCLYWVEHVELAGSRTRHEISKILKNTDEPEGTSSSDSEGVSPLPSPLPAPSNLANNRWFLIACAVRLKRSEDVSATAQGNGATPARSNGRNNMRQIDYHDGNELDESDAWKKRLTSSLPVWPVAETKIDTKLVRIISNDQLSSVSKIINEEGVVLKAPNMALAGVRLQPGDRLWLTGDLEGKTVEDVQKLRVRPPVTLVFVPCLRVDEACILEAGHYVDVHEFFSGFRENQRLLRPRPQEFDSFAGMAAHLRHIRRTAKRTQGSLVTPRPVRGMSARRNPLQAAHRGCK